MDGQDMAVEELGPTFKVIRPVGGALPAKLDYADYDKDPPTFETETLEYHRELAPHFSGSTAYFFDAEERLRAYEEDTREDPSDMLESCQHPLTTRASTTR